METDDFTSQHRNTNKMSPYSEEGKLSFVSTCNLTFCSLKKWNNSSSEEKRFAWRLSCFLKEELFANTSKNVI